MDASKDHGSRTSSTPATASYLRPRNRKVISGLDEGDETTFDPETAPIVRIASPLPSPYESRSASPIPTGHLTRPDSSHGKGKRPTSQSRQAGGSQHGGRGQSPALGALWSNSWTTLQSLASDLLGSDLSTAPGTKGNPGRRRRPLGAVSPRSSTSAPPPQWGPATQVPLPATSSIGTGSREEREATVRAKKREDMLANGETSYADALGRFKRRTSEDRASMSAPPGDDMDREALVYLHHVGNDDTLAGLTIKYHISAATLRRANRMWPNDAVQVRKTIVLPVDECGVKGKPVDGPEEMKLLGSESEALSAAYTEVTPTPATAVPNGDNASRGRTASSLTSATDRPLSSVGSSIDTEPPWRHESWVLLPNATKPTEVARLPRRTLGYFPPARRKSQCYSDLDTPSTSFDLARPSELGSHPAMSLSRQDPPQRPRRHRRQSNATNGYFPSYLAGPGGVGTMASNVRSPGPAQDGLNKLFAKRLPDVAPPRNQQGLYLPDIPIYSDELSAANTPVTSGTTTPNRNLNLENMGGAIEGWIRKLATKATTARESVERQQAVRASVGVPGQGAGGIGDLIEMADAFELGVDEEQDEEDERSRRRSVVHVGPMSSSGTSYGYGGVAQRARSENEPSKVQGKRAKDD